MLALEHYVAHELTFLAPNGALNVLIFFTALTPRCAAEWPCAMRRVPLYFFRDLLFALAKKVELAGEGHSAAWDECVY